MICVGRHSIGAEGVVGKGGSGFGGVLVPCLRNFLRVDTAFTLDGDMEDGLLRAGEGMTDTTCHELISSIVNKRRSG